ncbi:MAG: M10 family metallopeptidase C-terminal domain-containing protein, partial [Hyphomonadaceae bacterium]
MRLSGEEWGSGTLEVELGAGHRTFTVVSGDSLSSIEALASCGCPGCLVNLERKLANASNATPGGEDARTDVPVVEADETSGVDSVGNTTGTAVALAIGSSTNGWVNTAGDDDWYAVTLVAGQSYTFTMVGGTLGDAYLEIRNSAGTLIGFDDDFGSQYNATLRWTATDSGTYYINARAWEPDPGEGSPTLTGSYTLTAATSAPASPLDAIDYHYTMPTTSIAVWFSTPGYTNPLGDSTLRSWTQGEIDAVMAALATYSAITPLTFSVAASEGEATWIFTLTELEGNTLGYFSVGNQFAAFDPTVAGFTAGLVPGGDSWVTVIHEAGHGLGMAHPHDQGAINYGTNNSEVMQGVLDPFSSFGTFGLNRGLYTTMTYNDSAQSTPMALDVALMQQRYGVNPNTGAGDSAYALSLSASSYICIWDVGGTDTISYAGANNATIDLRAATLQNAIGGGGYVSSVQGILGGFTIANGVVIENASGGSGDDTLIGNDANNILNGGAGTDTMRGGLGDDTYYANISIDFVDEALNAGNDTVIASGSYTLFANVENLILTGAATNGTGNGLDNVITGNGNANTLSGLGGNDTLNGGEGADTMIGGLGNDTFYVDNAGDVVTENASEGTDTVRSTLASYTLSANVENLILETGALNGTGNALANTITGNSGNNILDGGAGADTMIGGNGDDTYVVDNAGDVTTETSALGGTDTVQSSVTRTLNANIENLVLTGGSAITGYGNILNNTITGNGAANQLYGFDGNDILDGGAGADNMFGGNGDDTYYVDNAGDQTTEVSALGGIDT